MKLFELPQKSLDIPTSAAKKINYRQKHVLKKQDEKQIGLVDICDW